MNTGGWILYYIYCITHFGDHFSKKKVFSLVCSLPVKVKTVGIKSVGSELNCHFVSGVKNYSRSASQRWREWKDPELEVNDSTLMTVIRHTDKVSIRKFTIVFRILYLEPRPHTIKLSLYKSLLSKKYVDTAWHICSYFNLMFEFTQLQERQRNCWYSTREIQIPLWPTRGSSCTSIVHIP